MVARIKKYIVNIITNPNLISLVFMGKKRIINKYNLTFDLSDPLIKLRDIGFLLWGLYEKSEIRFINKYLSEYKNCNILELGGSLGIVSCIISKNISKVQHLTIVEANPELIPIIKNNMELNNFQNYSIVNAAISFESSKSQVFFQLGDSNLIGHITETQNEKSIIVPCVRLQDLKIVGPYVIICDIEGAEVGLLLNESSALKNAELIILEAHDITFNGIEYSVEVIKTMFLKLGFVILDEYGDVFVFKKI
ncbi:MAG: FkbM family methyltransferase [Saprospiraceae bacterium]|nr:FkbM family methyltransferase [Candidatus Brachybacter algidus]